MGKNKKAKQEEPRGPFILAFETATPVSSVAVFERGEVLACQEYYSAQRHARLITVMVEHLLEDLGLRVQDLSAVCVAKGPGSYTGLRVGVSTAKGLCMALDLPLIAVSSLSGLAARVQNLARREQALICPMIDARRMEVYCEIYGSDLSVVEPVQARIVPEQPFDDLLAAQKVIFLGSGAAKCKELLETASDNALVLEDLLSSASSFAGLAWKRYQAGEFDDLLSFEPFYLKDFVATKPKKLL